MMRRSHGQRPAFVIITVFIVVGAMLLITMSLLTRAQLSLIAVSQSRDTAQRQSLVRSAVRLLLTRFDAQREVMLQSGFVELDDAYTVYEVGDRRGIVHLRPVSDTDRLATPLAGRLDVNRVTAEMLQAIEDLPPAIAENIIAYRTQRGRPITSLHDLLEVDGVDARLLFGSPVVDDDDDRAITDEAFALADVLTVHAVEPALQRSGRLRINLNQEWSDELATRLDERFGEGTSGIVKSIIDQGTTFSDDAVIFRVMVNTDLPREDWSDILDALTTSDDPFLYGRVNLNDAPIEVLAALPGLDMELAGSIIDARETLTPDEQETVAWPLLRDLIPAATYIELGPWLTTRSWTYRVVFEVGELFGEETVDDLDRPARYEAIIDCASPRARLASLRNITLEPLAYAIAPAGLEAEIDDFSMTNGDSDDRINEDAQSDVHSEGGPARRPAAPSASTTTPGSNAGTSTMEASSSAPSAGSRIGRWRVSGAGGTSSSDDE